MGFNTLSFTLFKALKSGAAQLDPFILKFGLLLNGCVALGSYFTEIGRAHV